jgi:hypothetical protein
MPEDDFEGHEGEEAVGIEGLVEGLPALGGVGDLGGAVEGDAVSLIVGGAGAQVTVEGVVDVLVPIVVVEAAVGLAEVLLEEVLGEPLLEDVEAEAAAVDPDAGMSDTRCRDAGLAEDLAGEEFVEVAGIFDGVLEVDAAEAEEAGVGLEACEIEGEGGFIVDGAEAAGVAFEVESDVGPEGGTGLEGGGDELAGVAVEGVEGGGVEGDGEVVELAVGEGGWGLGWGSSQFHWNCIMPMNHTFRAADCKSALRGFTGSVHGLSSVHNGHEPRCIRLSSGFDGEPQIKIKFKT